MTEPGWKALHEDLFYVEDEVRFYGARLQTRMVVARLAGRRLWVYSPLPMSEPLARALDALGDVTWVLSPNKIHNQGLSSFRARYPKAEIWASPGLPERRSDLSFTGVLGNAPEPAWADAIDQRATVGNCFFSEVVCLHRASRTLIVADLVETIAAETVPGQVARTLARLGGVLGRALPSPEFRLYTDDPDAARARLDEIAAWPFERILMAHGTLVETDAHAVFREVIEHLDTEVRHRASGRRRLYATLARYQ